MPHTVVQLSSHAGDGDAMHRGTWPMQALASLPEFRVIDVHYLSPYRYHLAFEADLLVLTLLQDVEFVPIVRWRKAKGKPTTFEVNDYIFQTDLTGPVYEVWNSPLTRVRCLQMMGLVDLVQTTSPFLAEAFEPYCSRVVVFPNQLKDVPSNLPQKGDRPFVVGWGGTISHLHDMAQIAPAVCRWVMGHEDVVLWLMGNKTIADLFTLPRERKRFLKLADMNAYGEFLQGVHVGLAPLRDTTFNRGRSDAKWLEYAASGCVFVGARVPSYTDSVEDGKTGFLFDDAPTLVRILDRLYQDRSLMESVRRTAFDYVTRHRRHEHHIHQRAAVYEELLARTPSGDAEGWKLQEESRFPRIDLPDDIPDYFAVTLQGDEQKALEGMYFDRPDLSENSIELVEERYGYFHFIGYARALAAAARGDFAAAERYLRRSLSFYPAAVKSLSLLGQVLLKMRRFREARDMLALAVQWNPTYVDTYPYLVNAAEQESDWEAAIAAAEEWEKCCNQDPRAPMIRGLLLIRSGRAQEGIEVMLGTIEQFKEGLEYSQLSFAAELVKVIRLADPLGVKEPRWSDLILKAAETFPYGQWLAARAGTLCFEKGDYERGARILRGARDRLLAWQWQSIESADPARTYWQLIEPYHIACEELAPRKPDR